MLEGSKHGAGVMPDTSVGMDQGAMPKVAMAGTSKCAAEQSWWWQSEAKVGNRCKARGNRAKWEFV